MKLVTLFLTVDASYLSGHYFESGMCYRYLRATIGARNPNLQVVITHASHVCSQHSFGLKMNGMHTTQFVHACFDDLSRETCAQHSDGAKLTNGPDKKERTKTQSTRRYAKRC